MLHYETVEKSTLELLKRLMVDDFLKDFVLVGGTALALRLGQRISIECCWHPIKNMSAIL